MNTSHYPSLELCKKLTEAGFPRTEMGLLDFGYDRANQGDIMPYDFCLDCEDHEGTTYRCPSIAELLDELQQQITIEGVVYTLNMDGHLGCWFYRWDNEFNYILIKEFGGGLPNALAECWLWLKENNLLNK